MLEKVLRVGVVRSYPYLIAKSSHVGVDANGTSYPLRHPTACGCWPDALSLWFGKVLPCFIAKPSFGGVTTLTSPHAATIRLGPIHYYRTRYHSRLQTCIIAGFASVTKSLSVMWRVFTAGFVSVTSQTQYYKDGKTCMMTQDCKAKQYYQPSKPNPKV
jgi:hypothetical protein